MIAFYKISQTQFACDGGQNVDDVKLPQRATASSAGYDVFAPCDIVLKKGEPCVVATGIKAQMPPSVVLLILPRSGLGFKYGLRLSNTVGVIDADYFDNPDNEGHIKIKLVAEQDVTIEKGKAFAQGIFVNYLLCDDDTSRGKRLGGFGSTKV